MSQTALYFSSLSLLHLKLSPQPTPNELPQTLFRKVFPTPRSQALPDLPAVFSRAQLNGTGSRQAASLAFLPFSF